MSDGIFIGEEIGSFLKKENFWMFTLPKVICYNFSKDDCVSEEYKNSGEERL